MQAINSAETDRTFTQKWAGIEVMGVNAGTAEKIRRLMPFRKGDNYKSSELETYLLTCKNIVKVNINREASCSSIGFSGGKVYLNVEIFPIKTKNVFRAIPIKKGKIKRLPPKLERLYENFNIRFDDLISKGNFPREKSSEHYRDFEDPKLSQIAIQLSTYAPKYNDVLLDIIKYSPDNEERSKVSELFAWSRSEKNLAEILKHDILLDPDEGVRNNIARSFLPILSKIKDKELLNQLLVVYCKQAAFPSHTDRNKALLSLLKILEQNKDLTSTMSKECTSTLKYISKMSILENSGGFANKILKLAGDSKFE